MNKIWNSGFPDLEELTSGLRRGLQRGGRRVQSVRVLRREPNIYSSTFPSEIITCRVDDRTRRLFCKYSVDTHANTYGHRGDLLYEAEVYRQILSSSGVSTACFYGMHQNKDRRQVWLFLEYLESLWLSKAHDTNAMPAASRWLASFHASNRGPKQTQPSFLRSYDADYFAGWPQRTLEYSSMCEEKFTWLETICREFRNLIDLLIAQPATVIHGEFTVHNVLYRDGVICPIDWQSAAVAPGVVDLAALTDGWPDHVVRECQHVYEAHKDIDDEPAEFDFIFAVAMMYWLFRWLGDRPSWTAHPVSLRRFQKLRELGERVGIL